MKSLKSIMVTLLVLSISLCNAQLKNMKTSSVQIDGNCGMCKTTIENAGNKKKESTIIWDKESKIALISYDSLKTNIRNILKKVALVGYDNEMFMAPNDTYQSLPNCCQYKRIKQEETSSENSEMDMTENHSGHSAVDTSETSTNEENVKPDYLAIVFDNYFEVKNGLVQSDGKLTSIKATALVKAIDNVQMNELEMDVHMVWMKVMKDLKTEAKAIADSDLESIQRTNFISLSNNIYSLMKLAKYQVPVYYQFCPMANDGKGANWLSTENDIKNPYYGATMLSCGKTVETIKK